MKTIIDPSQNLISTDKVSAIHYPYTRRHFFTAQTKNEEQEKNIIKKGERFSLLLIYINRKIGEEFSFSRGEIGGGVCFCLCVLSLKETKKLFAFVFYFWEKKGNGRKLNGRWRIELILAREREETVTEVETEIQKRRGEKRRNRTKTVLKERELREEDK